jgi:predicted methyltransferase
MKTTLSSLTLVLALGCAGAEVAPAVQPAAPPPSAAPAPTAETAPAPPPPSAEELKKAEEQKQLEQDFAKLEQQNAAELARLTPEVRAQVKALVDAGGGGIKSAINAALKGPQRRPGHAERDAQRHPLQTLDVLGVQPNHKLLEVGPGEGWYTELLAPALAKNGKLYVTLTDPNGPKTERATYYGKRTQLFLDSLPEAYGAVERVMFDPKQPAVALADGTLDSVLLFRGAHGMVNSGTLEVWLAEFHRTLKAKGTLGIEQHRAAVGADPSVSSKQGYLPEAYVIEQVQKAGFKLLTTSEINANPKDTKDHPNGVWSLAPSFRGGDADRAKFAEIGESDRMTLKFVKVARPAAPAAAPAKK